MILVTGATGIVGRTLLYRLLASGVERVVGLRRSSSELEDVAQTFLDYDPAGGRELFEKIIWRQADLLQPETLPDLLAGITEVYHAAAMVSFDPKDDKKLFQTNVEGTRNLLYAVENSAVNKFCYISSIATLDGKNEQGEVDEEQYFNPKLRHSEYQRTKFLAEMEVWRASAEGLNCVIVNPGMIIGSGNWQSSSGVLFSTALNSPFTFSGGTGYVDVRDVAAAAIDLMAQNHFGERFLLVSENWSYQKFYDAVRQRTDQKPIKVLPDWLLTVMKFIAPMLSPFSRLMRMATRPNLEALTGFTPYSNDKVRERLDFHFIAVEDSIRFHLQNYLRLKKSNHDK